MAEYKRYITQFQDNGSVMISEDVVSTIVAHAAEEVEGVASLVTRKNWGKSIKIMIGENNELTIDCSVVIRYGQSVVTVAKAVQDAAIVAVESVTGVKVTTMNVNVCGIVHE